MKKFKAKEAKPVRTIEVNGHNWAEVFALSCVQSLEKERGLEGNVTKAYATFSCQSCIFYGVHFTEECPSASECYIIEVGDVIEEYAGGKWFVKKKYAAPPIFGVFTHDPRINGGKIKE